MVGLRYGFYPRVISYQSKVDKTISQTNHEIIYLSHSNPYLIARKKLVHVLFYTYKHLGLPKQFNLFKKYIFQFLTKFNIHSPFIVLGISSEPLCNGYL